MNRWLNRACWVLLWACVLTLAWAVVRLERQIAEIERRLSNPSHIIKDRRRSPT